ncbi:ABC transporter permease [Silvibacterium sp.]|uniref:ABC transporter permease n=1 Tax=Silvibacterium sp. TaxID=1964179 RepID=UPI0039E29C6A
MNIWGRIFGRKRMERELAEEMRLHVEERAEQLMRSEGLSREEAELRARRAFGNAALTAERSREHWQWPRTEQLLADVKYALRQLAKSPGITLVAVLTLALGIGANTAIFTLTWNIVLRGLPVRDPGRLVVYELRNGDTVHGLSGPLYTLLRARQKTSTDMLAWTDYAKVPVSRNGQTSLERLQLLTVNSFGMLGLQPQLGRAFSAQDAQRPVALVSDAYWRSRFGAREDVIGKTLNVSGHVVTIVGVMPAVFQGLTANTHPAVYVPFDFANQLWEKDDTTRVWPEHFGFYVMGRLKPSASLRQAQAELAALEPQLRKDADPAGTYLAQFFKMLRLAVEDGSSGFSWMKTTYRSPLFVLELLVVLLLLLCSINTALVMLARVSGRQQEYALRMVLGARRGRIVQQVLVETLLLIAPGLAGGVLPGWLGAHALSGMLSSNGGPQELALRPNAVIVAVNVGAALLVALGAGLIPAVRAAGAEPATETQMTSRTVSRGQTGGWAIPLQVALSLCLLSTAMLLGRTLMRLTMGHPGFVFENTAAVTVDLTPLQLTDVQGNAFLQRFAAALEAQPGVQSVGFTGMLPLASHYTVSRTFSLDGHGAVHSDGSMFFASVTPGYFAAAGTRLLEGESPKMLSDARVCVLGESLARFFFPDEDALGRVVYFATQGKPDGTVLDPKASCRVVGVAEDAKYVSLRRPMTPVLYELFRLNALSDYAPSTDADLLVRASSTQLALQAVHRAATDVLPATAVVNARSFAARADDDLSRERMLVWLSGGFSMLALLLTALGLYGLVMRAVTLRTREIGIRVALGAQRGSILIALGRRTVLEVLAGLAAGAVGATLLGRAIARMLATQSPLGMGRALLAAGMILLVAVLALIVPGLRALRVDPMRALRSE